MDNNNNHQNESESENLEEQEGDWSDEPEEEQEPEPESEEEEKDSKTEQTLECQQSLLTPDVFEHPIFSFKEDKFLGPLGEFIKSLLVPFPTRDEFSKKLQMFEEFLVTSIFGKKSVAELKQEFVKLGLESKTMCGGFISKEMLCFRCLDCEVSQNEHSSTSLICVPCFDKSNHKGHRVIALKSSGYCDCGDNSLVKPEGFCPDHKRIELDRETELKKFPAVLVKTSKEMLNKAFYGSMAIFDIVQKLKKGNSCDALLLFGQGFLNRILDFIEKACQEMSSSFVLLVNSLLESKFQAPYNKMRHDCDCLKHLGGDSSNHPIATHDCKCSILSLVFRYSVYIEKGGGAKLKTKKVLTECLKEEQFRRFAGPEMAKYFRFFIPLAYLTNHGSITENSELFGSLDFIICNNVDLTLNVLRSGYFHNFLEVIKETVNNYGEASIKMAKTSSVFSHLAYRYARVEFKDSTKMLISETNTIKEILDILLTFQKKYFYNGATSLNLHDHEIDYNTMLRTLRIQKRILEWVLNILKYISKCDPEEREEFFKMFAKEWYTRYQQIGSQDKLSMTPVFERILCYMLRSYEYELSQEGILTFFAKYLPGIKLEELAETVIGNVLKYYGFTRFLAGVLDPDMQRLLCTYYEFWGNYSEVDVLLVQKMILIASPKNLLEVIGDNFFWFDQNMKTQWKDPSSFLKSDDERIKRKQIVLKDFLRFLVYLMNDELCLYNVNAETAFPEKLEADPNNERVVQKATANIMLKEYWTDYALIKENLSNSILYNASKVSRILPKISVYNDKDQKIRVKDELEAELDPYIFYKTPLLQADIIIKAASRIEKNPDIDIIAGKSYSDLQKHLYVIRMKMFQSNLSGFLSKIIVSSNKMVQELVPTALKLVLLNLQSQQQQNDGSSLIKNNILNLIQENYSKKKEFIDTLNALSKKDDFKECKSCILKIKSFLQPQGDPVSPLTPNTPSTSDEIKVRETKSSCFACIFGKPKKRKTHSVVVTPLASPSGAGDDDIEKEKRRKAAQEKMKAEFAKKQAAFADKNKGAFEETKPEAADMTCPHCLVRIDQNKDAYGVPMFITNTTNYVTPPYTDSWKVEQNFTTWMPVLSSCYHYYHKKCFGQAYKNTKASQESVLFKNSMECYCSLCKTLCNYFHVISEGSEKGPELISDIFSIGIFRTMMNLMMTQRFNVGLDQLVVFSWSFDGIPKRMIKYFMETFYLNEKPEEFEKLYELYLSFFKSLKNVNQASIDVSKCHEGLLTMFEEEKKNIEFKPDTPSIYYSNISPEQILNEKFARITLTSVMCGENDQVKKQELLELQLKAFCEYIQTRMCLNFALETKKDPKECVAYYKDNMNLLKDFLLDTLISPISKFILFIYFNKCLLGAEKNTKAIYRQICELISESDMDKLFSLVGIPYTVEGLLNKCLLLENAEQIQDYVQQTIKDIPENVLKVRPENFTVRFVNLPQTYAEFNNTFYRQKCKFCDSYSKNKKMSLCLICGDVMCESFCEWSGYAKPLGNFNTHACASHIGTAAFYSLFDNTITIVVSPFNVVTHTKGLYSDRFGRSINQAFEDECDMSEWLKIDFKQFVLNSKVLKELRHMIIHQEVEKESFKKTLNLQLIPQGGSL